MAAQSQPKQKKVILTWQEKLEKGLPLNHLESVKAAAHRLTTRRLKEQEEEAELAALERSTLSAKQVKAMQSEDSKKGE